MEKSFFSKSSGKKLLKKGLNLILYLLMALGIGLILVGEADSKSIAEFFGTSPSVVGGIMTNLGVGLFTTGLITVLIEATWGNYQRDDQNRQFSKITRGFLKVENQLQVFKDTGLEFCYHDRASALENFSKYAKKLLENTDGGSYIEVVSSSAKGMIGSTLGDDHSITYEWRKLYKQYPSRFKFILTHPALAHLRRSIEGRSNGHIEVEIFRSTLFLLVEAAKKFLLEKFENGSVIENKEYWQNFLNIIDENSKNEPSEEDTKNAITFLEHLRGEFTKYVHLRYYRGSPTVFTVRVDNHLLFNPYSYGSMAKDSLCLEFQTSKNTSDINRFYDIHFSKTWRSGVHKERGLDGRPIVQQINSLPDLAHALCDCLLLADNSRLRLNKKQVVALEDYYNSILKYVDDDDLKNFYGILSIWKKANKDDDYLPDKYKQQTMRQKETNDRQKRIFQLLVRFLLQELDINQAGEINYNFYKNNLTAHKDFKKKIQPDKLKIHYPKDNRFDDISNYFQEIIRLKNFNYFPDPETNPTIIISLNSEDKDISGSYEFEFNKDIPFCDKESGSDTQNLSTDQDKSDPEQKSKDSTKSTKKKSLHPRKRKVDIEVKEKK